MQRDSLEKFVLENREAFDDAIPSLKVWGEIDRSVNRREARRITLRRSLRIAAGVLFLLFAGALAGHYLSGLEEENPVAVLENVAPEYFEMAQYYEGEISSKEKQLAAYQQGETVLEDFAQLDEAMEELKEELLHAPKGQEEQIVENLIKNYQTKIQILERVLERIQSNTNQEQFKPADDEISI